MSDFLHANLSLARFPERNKIAARLSVAKYGIPGPQASDLKSWPIELRRRLGRSPGVARPRWSAVVAHIQQTEYRRIPRRTAHPGRAFLYRKHNAKCQ